MCYWHSRRGRISDSEYFLTDKPSWPFQELHKYTTLSLNNNSLLVDEIVWEVSKMITQVFHQESSIANNELLRLCFLESLFSSFISPQSAVKGFLSVLVSFKWLWWKFSHWPKSWLPTNYLLFKIFKVPVSPSRKMVEDSYWLALSRFISR